jgi:predicted nucleic acid-binding protein
MYPTVVIFCHMLIFDASTLILTARIELLDKFLDAIPMKGAIPKEVERECCSVKKSLDALQIQRAVDQSRIKVLAVKNKRLVTKVQADFGLGKGEAEAIALALAEKAQIIGIDDKNGINACKLLGLAFTTALGILIRSHFEGLISLTDAHEKMEMLTRFGRYKRSIIEDARLRLEGGK